MAIDQPKYTERADQDAGAARAEQRREAAQAWPATGSAVGTDAQAKGFAQGALTGAVIGVIVLLPFALIDMGDFPVAGRLLLLAVVGALAGGTAGALYWGGRKPELEGETVDADGRPAVGTSPRDPETDATGRPRR